MRCEQTGVDDVDSLLTASNPLDEEWEQDPIFFVWVLKERANVGVSSQRHAVEGNRLHPRDAVLRHLVLQTWCGRHFFNVADAAPTAKARSYFAKSTPSSPGCAVVRQ